MPDRPFFALAFPPSPGDWLVLATLLLLLTFVLVFWITQPTGRQGDVWARLLARLRSQTALRLLLAIFLPIWLLALLATGWTLLGTLPLGLTAQAPGPTLGTGALLVALLGAPFLIWRSIVAQRTVDLAAESLLNDKLNAAATDLAARRQVTRSVMQDGKEVILTEWHDDLVTRAAAIDRLEGLATEHPDIAPRIANLLSVYLRELSAEYPPKDAPEGASTDDLEDWADDLKPARSDMEKAAQTLGRLRRIDRVDLTRLKLDLRRANLQSFDLNGLDFEKADLSFARMGGAYLIRARLERADLFGARLERADLFAARLQGVNLHSARLEGADLRLAGLDENTSLSGATLRGAALRHMSLSTAPISQLQLNETFGDGTVILPDGFTRPAHWPNHALDWDDFNTEWRKWQANPATYTPPPPPD